MGEESKATSTVAYIDGQPVEVTGEPMQFTVAHMEDGEIVPDKPDFSAGGVSAADLADAIDTVKNAWAAVTMTIEVAATAIRKIAKQLVRAWEFQQAAEWAAVHNPRLVRFYQHTKKKRIRKKYAKRILAWYREEVLGCYD